MNSLTPAARAVGLMVWRAFTLALASTVAMILSTFMAQNVYQSMRTDPSR